MRAVLLAVLLVVLPRSGWGQGLEGATGRIEKLLAESFGRSFPLVAASAGVTYRFDPVTASFEREPALMGQLFLERADPLGKGRWNMGVSYQYVALDTIEGQDAADLRDPLPLALAGAGGVVIGAATIDRLSIRAASHQFTVSVTYGVTDDLDVNATVPVLYSDLHATADITRLLLVPTPSLEHITADSPDTATGVGDAILRAKYRLVARDPVHVATGLIVRFPTGDPSTLQGTGEYELAPMLYVSTRAFEPATWARLSAHANAGADLIAGDVGSSELRWAVGLDWAVSEGATAAVAVLGRHPLRRLAKPGFFEFVRVLPNGQLGVAPLFGLDGQRPDYYDLSLGGRVNVWRDTVIAFANAIVPLNAAGIRTEIIPLVGTEVAW
ncbi:MAG: transporter [Candidatus Binatia bacterium]